jgi:dTDP-4-amino-4,6-dideoxygalactose transaminase
LLDLGRQYAPLREAIVEALVRVADSQRFILGPEVDALEHELALALDIPHVVAVSSGTDALLVALMALGIGPGDEVIVPTYSFFATAGSVCRVGATPVFVDIDPVTFGIDADATARALSPKTRAILPVHLYGLPCDLDPILALAARTGAAVIEDAAQAIGARYRGRPVGGIGTAGCFSFFPSKNLGAFGDGGFVTTTDAALAAEIRLLRNHGAEPKYFHARIGGNFRLDAIQAAVLRVKLPHLAAWTEARQRNAHRYRELAAEFGFTGRIELPSELDDRTHIYNQFVIRGPERDALRAHLTARGIGTEIYYPVPFHEQACFAGVARAAGPFAVADRAAATSLALPIFGELTADEQRHVMASVAAFYDGAR